ncbi:MAG: response regulator [Lachnospiraceae bacterium]|nr:response regulator [Lachnospiraceae bacterium]
MTILAVDNEEIALEGLCRTIRSAIPEAKLYSAPDPEKAFLIAAKERPDIVFLDIEMPGMDGLTLAKKIKEQVEPRTNIIFTTGYNEYIAEAFTKLRVSGYLLKPITEDMILNEIENLRYPAEIRGSRRVRVRTFGSFEVFIKDKPVFFHYSKTRELCAYLIDHGGTCRIAELQENLWEEKDGSGDHRSYLQNLISD